MQLIKLKNMFLEQDIEWRVSRAGMTGDKVWAMVLAYVTNRAIMERLDDVLGQENWKNEYLPAPNGGTLCGLSIKIGDEWVTKYDGADNTNFEAVKGGLSGAMKRAGVQWGIGRYLYRLPEMFAVIDQNGVHYTPASYDKNNKQKHPAFKWEPPKLPTWAVPVNDYQEIVDTTVKVLKAIKLPEASRKRFEAQYLQIHDRKSAEVFFDDVQKEAGASEIVKVALGEKK